MNQLTAPGLLEDGFELFSFPDIHGQISEMMTDSRFSVGDVGHVIAKDPALTARLLQLVNGSSYGYQGKIDTVSRAIVVVSFLELKDVVTTTSVIDNFTDVPSDLIDMTAFWLHSMICAVLAKLLAKESIVLNSERLFMAGLLHNIGSLVMYQKCPDQSVQVLLAADKDKNKVAEYEKDIFGFTHADVSGELIKQWGLPESLYDSITYYLCPSIAQVHRLEAYILSIAVKVANAIERCVDLRDNDLELDEEGLLLMRMSKEQVLDISGRVGDEFPRVFDLLAPNKKFH